MTCSRNVANESIAQKLEACDADILVVGAPGRIGSTARKYLLDSKVGLASERSRGGGKIVDGP